MDRCCFRGVWNIKGEGPPSKGLGLLFPCASVSESDSLDFVSFQLSAAEIPGPEWMMTSPLLWIWPLFGVLFCHHTSAQSVYSLSGNKNSTIVFKPTWPAGSSSVYHVAFRFRTRSLNSPLFRIIQSDAGTATASHATVLRISDGHLQIVHPFSGGVELHSSPECKWNRWLICF